jgi:hypothetical protein
MQYREVRKILKCIKGVTLILWIRQREISKHIRRAL